MSASDPIPPDARRFSIRLPRPLWIGVAAGGLIVMLLWLHLGVPIYRQQVAIQEIRHLGGTIMRKSPRVPEWFRAQLSDEWKTRCDEILEVYLSGRPATDESMRRLKGLTSLEVLAVNKTQVTDAGLAIVEGMPHLKLLWLDDTHVTDAGLKHVRSLTRLERLPLRSTRVTDSGLMELA